MSCIENGKIKADEESLKYIAEKLQIDYNYLTQDVYEQIKSNIENIKTNNYSLEKLDKMIGYNLEYSCKHNYNDLALELIHILFEVYIQNNKLEKNTANNIKIL